MRLLRRNIVTIASFLVLAGSAKATNFSGPASGPAVSDGCTAAADLSLLGGAVTDTLDGLQYAGSLVRVSIGAGILTFSPCSITYTNTRTLDEIAGTYTLTSEIDANVTLLGAALTSSLSLLGISVGPSTITVNSYLAGEPGDVATALLNLNTLALLGSVNASGSTTVHTLGSDTLVQEVTFHFGGTANNLLSLGLNLDVLGSPAFNSSITLLEADPPPTGAVPEPGTVALLGLGLAGIAARKRFWNR